MRAQQGHGEGSWGGRGAAPADQRRTADHCAPRTCPADSALAQPAHCRGACRALRSRLGGRACWRATTWLVAITRIDMCRWVGIPLLALCCEDEGGASSSSACPPPAQACLPCAAGPQRAARCRSSGRAALRPLYPSPLALPRHLRLLLPPPRHDPATRVRGAPACLAARCLRNCCCGARCSRAAGPPWHCPAALDPRTANRPLRTTNHVPAAGSTQRTRMACGC